VTIGGDNEERETLLYSQNVKEKALYKRELKVFIIAGYLLSEVALAGSKLIFNNIRFRFCCFIL
jgi:hypothetical protein